MHMYTNQLFFRGPSTSSGSFDSFLYFAFLIVPSLSHAKWFTMSKRSESNGAGWGNRTPVLSLENLYISRYTNPARNSGDYII